MSGSNENEAAWIASLLAGYVAKTLTESEKKELNQWVAKDQANKSLFENLTDIPSLEIDRLFFLFTTRYKRNSSEI